VERNAGLAALKAYELLSRLIAACLGVMTLMWKEDHPRKISSDEQAFVVLESGSANGGRSQISCISFSKSKLEDVEQSHVFQVSDVII